MKNTDARIPGDQFFTDERTADAHRDRRRERRLDGADATPVVLRSFRLSPTGRHV